MLLTCSCALSPGDLRSVEVTHWFPAGIMETHVKRRATFTANCIVAWNHNKYYYSFVINFVAKKFHHGLCCPVKCTFNWVHAPWRRIKEDTVGEEEERRRSRPTSAAATTAAEEEEEETQWAPLHPMCSRFVAVIQIMGSGPTMCC